MSPMQPIALTKDKPSPNEPSSPKKNEDTIKVSFITSNDFDLNLDTIERNLIGTPELTTLCNDDVGTSQALVTKTSTS